MAAISGVGAGCRDPPETRARVPRGRYLAPPLGSAPADARLYPQKLKGFHDFTGARDVRLQLTALSRHPISFSSSVNYLTLWARIQPGCILQPLGHPWLAGAPDLHRPTALCQHRPTASSRQGPGVGPQVGADAVGAGEPADGHGVEPLAREAGVAHAVETAHAGADERQRQQARQPQRRDRAVAAAHAAQEAAVACGACPPLDGGWRQPGQAGSPPVAGSAGRRRTASWPFLQQRVVAVGPLGHHLGVDGEMQQQKRR